MPIHLNPVAAVMNSRKDLSDDFWGTVISEIELNENIPAEAFNGIDEFSHLEIIFILIKRTDQKLFSTDTHGEIRTGRMLAYSPSEKRTGQTE